MKYPTYPKYKSSGVDWLGDVPGHWELKRARFCMYVNPPSGRLRELRHTDEVSFVPMEAVGENGGLQLDMALQKGEIGGTYTEFQDGDVIVAKITPCFENGKGALARGLTNGVALGTTELHVLRPFGNLDCRFLFYLTISTAYRKTGEAEMYGAGGQKRVPVDFVRDFPTPLPPLAEQRAIADFLDVQTAKLDTLIAKKRELIEKLKEQRYALISRTVTRSLPPDAARAAGLDPHPKLKPSGVEWLGEVPEHWEVGRLRRWWIVLDCKHRTVEFVDEGMPVVSIAEVHGSQVDIDNAKRTTWADYTIMIEGGRRPLPGDLIFSRNATVASAALVVSQEPFCMGQDVCLIRSRSQSGRYLQYVAASSQLLNQAETLMIGSTFRRINVEQIKEFWITRPPFDEQQAAADYLDHETGEIDAMVAKVEAAIERLQEYRTTIITAAVTGKIDVRGASAVTDTAPMTIGVTGRMDG